jgi:hypothetical protein
MSRVTSSPPLPRMAIAEGRTALKKAGFDPGPSAGARSELWIRRKDQCPALIAYSGPPWGEYFLKESVDNALNMK